MFFPTLPPQKRKKKSVKESLRYTRIVTVRVLILQLFLKIYRLLGVKCLVHPSLHPSLLFLYLFVLMEFIHHSSHLYISLISLQVWFQNRRMKDKRQRHTMPWPHPLVDPLGALLMGRASPSSSALPYPFIPPPLPHIPLHQYPSLALSLPATSAHSPYSATMRPLDALRLFQYSHSRPGGLPPAAALYPSAGGAAVRHPSSCPCPLCLHSRPELLKTRGEALGLGQPRGLKATIQPADVEWTEEIV